MKHYMKDDHKTSKIDSILSKIMRNNFKSFLIKSFYTLNPNKKFYDSWYIDLMIEYLKAAKSKKIKRLIINIPPRSLKSISVSVAWPAWLLGNNPSTKIITVSYSMTLSQKHSEDSRRIISSNWYQRHFPKTKILKGSNTKGKFITTAKGFRFSTSTGGTLTGEGEDYIIIDDPMTPLQAMNINDQKKMINWYEQTLSSRLDDKKMV